MGVGTSARRWRHRAAGLSLALAACLLAACSGTAPAAGSATQSTTNSGSGSSTASSATAPTTIVFATQGLGTEGKATQAAVAAFEQANPAIKVKIQTLSASSDQAYQSLVTTLAAGSATPDVITSDVIWPPAFAAAGWIMPLGQFNPNLSDFFPGMVEAGKWQGKQYAIPWFINVEGLYYRTDLVSSPPKTFAELTQDAKAAQAKDPSVKYGLVFEGDKYEGGVTVFQDVLGGFGGHIVNGSGQPTVNTPQAAQALGWLSQAITSKLAPAAVTGWQEGDVQKAFLSGDAVFATNWPYMFQLAEASGSAVKGKVGFAPPPATPGGTPTASLGGDVLVINAKTKHAAAAWKLVQYLTSGPAMAARAEAAGDPPARKDAYTKALLAQAPYYAQEEAVYADARPRPVTPNWPKLSSALQIAISDVYSGQATPQKALAAAQTQMLKIVSGSSGS